MQVDWGAEKYRHRANAAVKVKRKKGDSSFKLLKYIVVLAAGWPRAKGV